MLLPLQTPVQPLLLPGTEPLHQLLIGHVQKLLKVHAMVDELVEGVILLLLYFCHLVSSLERSIFLSKVMYIVFLDRMLLHT